MSAPCLSTTGDDARFYNSPWTPESNKPSITTNIKNGMPKPAIVKWSNKLIALNAIENLDVVIALKERIDANA